MPRTTKEQRESAARCGVPGCLNPWASNWNGSRKCVLHMEPIGSFTQTKQIPTTPPAKAWSDTDRNEDAEEI